MSERKRRGAPPPPPPVEPPPFVEPPPVEPRPETPEDVEAALRFVHLTVLQTRAQLSELVATVNAMTEVLVAQGTLPMDQLQRRRHLTVLRENERIAEEDLGVEVADVPDKYALANLPEIDCEARLPLCGARCCASEFALSVQDLDERVVRWDYARPYRIARRTDDGHCVHNDAGTGACEVYAHRPAACRLFDCRGDERIWIDFDRRIPAP
jgi:Fe-S-cluster containining protein